jgi:hypothetical protein
LVGVASIYLEWAAWFYIRAGWVGVAGSAEVIRAVI